MPEVDSRGGGEELGGECWEREGEIRHAFENRGSLYREDDADERLDVRVVGRRRPDFLRGTVKRTRPGKKRKNGKFTIGIH